MEIYKRKILIEKVRKHAFDQEKNKIQENKKENTIMTTKKKKENTLLTKKKKVTKNSTKKKASFHIFLFSFINYHLWLL